MTAGLKTIISLSFVHFPFHHPSTSTNPSQVLAIGFLLVILSCALFKQYLPLLVVATYVLAPIPNWVCGRCANPDDFVESSSNAVVDFGRFCTGFLVLMGVGMSPIYFTIALEWRMEGLMSGSSPCAASALGNHPLGGGADVYYGRGADLRHHHCVWDVLSRGARILISCARLGLG